MRDQKLPRVASVFGCLLAMLCLLATGCGEAPKIERSRVLKPAALPADDRMLAAIVPVEGKGYFFKMSGSGAAVKAELPNFQALLESLSVADGKLKWKKPEGWSKQAGSGMREATFKIGQGDSELECTVISLPADDPKSDDYLLSNINRWRGQMGLSNLAKADLSKITPDGELRRLTLKDGTPVTWVSLEGSLSSGGGMPPFANAPFANRGAGEMQRPGAERPGPEQGPTAQPAEPAASDEFSFTAPQGWKPGTTGPFRKAAFEVADGDQKCEITISSLAAAGSALLPNINRWRGQIGLKEIEQAELQKVLEPISIDGRDGHVVELTGDRKSIFGAVVIVGDQGWFVKLTGDKALADREKASFMSFAKSLKFK